jgi:hypothetical protein
VKRYSLVEINMRFGKTRRLLLPSLTKDEDSSESLYNSDGVRAITSNITEPVKSYSHRNFYKNIFSFSSFGTFVFPIVALNIANLTQSDASHPPQLALLCVHSLRDCMSVYIHSGACASVRAALCKRILPIEPVCFPGVTTHCGCIFTAR